VPKLSIALTLMGCLALAACQPSAPEAPAPDVEPKSAQPAQPARPQAAPAPAAPASAAPEQQVGLVRVTDPSTVCMVNNHYMGRPQIPVQVDGKTYYGCCQMCEKRLRDEPSARNAIDPVTQKQVDKALALMARDPEGKVFYFENEASLTQGGVKL
jgi:YHS domain-containing protein